MPEVPAKESPAEGFGCPDCLSQADDLLAIYGTCHLSLLVPLVCLLAGCPRQAHLALFMWLI